MCPFTLKYIRCSQFRSALNQRNSREGLSALACSNFSFFEDIWCQRKGFKVGRKTWEDFTFPLYSVFSWVSCVKLVLFLLETEVRNHQQVRWNFYTLRKRGWSSLTWRLCGFLVCLTCRFRVLLQTSQECVLKTFLPFWVCCLQAFQSKALQIF